MMYVDHIVGMFADSSRSYRLYVVSSALYLAGLYMRAISTNVMEDFHISCYALQTKQCHVRNSVLGRHSS